MGGCLLKGAKSQLKILIVCYELFIKVIQFGPHMIFLVSLKGLKNPVESNYKV